jgi:outer membrane protein assembly factor BamB
MHIKSILALVALSTLTACASWNASDEDKPFPLPKIAQTQQNLSILWQQSVGDPLSDEEGQSLLGTINTDVVVASDNGNITRINSQNGNIVWQTKVKKISLGIAVSEKYITFIDKDNKLIVLNANDGKQIWKTTLDIEVKSSPFITNKIVVLRTTSNKLIAFNLDTQQLVWQYERIAQGLLLHSKRNSMVTPKKDVILAGFHGAKVVLLDANTGSQKWEQTLSYSKGFTESERINDIVASPVVYADTACTASYQGKIGCFDLNNGGLAWEAPFSTSQNLINDATGIYATNIKGQISAFDYNGNLKWQQKDLTNRHIKDGIVLDNTIIFNDFKGYMHLINKNNGNLVGQFKLDDTSVPMIKLGLIIIAHTNNGKIYGLKLNSQ